METSGQQQSYKYQCTIEATQFSAARVSVEQERASLDAQRDRKSSK